MSAEELVNNERSEVGKSRKSDGLPQRPGPRFQFPLHDGYGAHALHREEVEDDQGGRGSDVQQGLAGSGVDFGGQPGLQGRDAAVFASGRGVERAEGADEDFAGGE